MKTKPGLFLLAVLLFAATNAHAQDANFFIFLCFGQSNMEGFPGVEPQDKTVDDRFQVLATVDFPNMGRTKGNWYPAVPPLCRSTTGLCPADYFGRTLVSKLPANIRVGIVNVSVAGCNRGAPEWHPASGEIKAACACAAEFCRERGADIARLAVQFSTSCPALATTLVGTAEPENLKKNVQWLDDIRRLAGFPKVACKISGMVTEADWHGWKSVDFTPYLDVIFEAFGVDRIMIGSDWPVCTVSAPYHRVMSIALDYVQRLSDHEQEMVLGQNVSALYRIH
jgi:hypothetical protein